MNGLNRKPPSRRQLLLVCLLLACGCTGAQDTGRAANLVPPERVARFALDRLTAVDNAVDPCTSEAFDLEYPVTLVPLNQELCWNCSNVGWLLREWKRADMSPPLLVVTLRSAVKETCRFLAEQRVNVPVFVVEDEGVPLWWNAMGSVVLAEAVAPMTLGRVTGDPDGFALLEAW